MANETMTLEEVVNKVKAIAEDAKGLKVYSEKLKELETAITELKKAEPSDAVKELIKGLSDRADSLEADIKKGFKQSKEEFKSFTRKLAEKMLEKKDSIKELMENGGAKRVNFDVDIDLKAAGTMTITGNYSGGTVGLTDWDPVFTRVVRRQPFLRQLVTVRTTNARFVAWAEKANPDPGAAGMTAEGAAKTQTDFDIVERSKKVEKITAFIKVSKEMLEDIDYIQSEIEQELIELINLKLDEQLLSGDDASPNLKGILEYAPDFDVTGTPLAGGVAEANNFDVFRAAVALVNVANFNPNYAIVNTMDAAVMDLTKASDGHYIMPPFSTANGQTIAGLQIIVNNGVPAGTFLVGDFSKSILAIRKNITIDMGYENDDFTKNLVTILAEMRAVHYIKSNNVGAFVQGTFDAAKAALLAEVAPEV